MTVIEKLRKRIKRRVVYAKDTALRPPYMEYVAYKAVMNQIREVLKNIDSLASERCVWEEKPDPDFDGAHYYETQCGLLMDDETAYGWFQGDTSHWGNCRCGKRIEVKEADNGY